MRWAYVHHHSKYGRMAHRRALFEYPDFTGTAAVHPQGPKDSRPILILLGIFELIRSKLSEKESRLEMVFFLSM